LPRSTVELAPAQRYPRFMALHHRFTYLAFSGSAFSGDLRIEFVDGLNTPIGGCGVGKTGVLECLPFALGMKPARGREAQSESHLQNSTRCLPPT